MGRRLPHFLRLGFRLRIVRVDEGGDRRCLGHQFVQQLQTFSVQRSPDQAHAGDIAARSIEAGDEAGLDWIGGTDEDNWNCGGRSSCSPRRVAAASSKDHDLTASIKLAATRTIFLGTPT